MIYLDTSAALQLVMPEAETAGLELWIAERSGVPRVSSRLLRIEMLRSVARTAPQRMTLWCSRTRPPALNWDLTRLAHIR
jgi:hypothetical protein